MGLDIYVGPVTRYVAGDWQTIVQQAGADQGIPVEVMRLNEPPDAITDVRVVDAVVHEWRSGLLASLETGETWEEDPLGEYKTDKPDWDGYGAVILLAAYDERPDLKPGSSRGLFRGKTERTKPEDFPDSEAFKVASQSPQRYPTLLSGAEWCLPLRLGPRVFRTSAPNGHEMVMGRVPVLLEELRTLNERTLRLADGDLRSARQAGPPELGSSSVESAGAFGLAAMIPLTDFADQRRLTWIMDY